MFYVEILIAFNVGFVAGAYWRGVRSIKNDNQRKQDLEKIVHLFKQV